MIKRKARRTTKPVTQKGFGYEMPPDPALVQIYFGYAGFPEEARRFLKSHNKANWCGPQGGPHRNWKVLASVWIKKLTR